MKALELHLKVEQNTITAIDLISRNSSMSIGLIKKIMFCGAVWLSRGKSVKRLRRATKTLLIDDIIHVYYNEQIINLKAINCPLIVDRGDYSIWNKPSGIFSQGTRYGDHYTIQRFAEKNLTPQRNAFIVHRLDRDANGLIILAHSKKAAILFSALFKNHGIIKTYQIIVEGILSIPTLPHTINTPVDNKKAISIIEKLTYLTDTNQTKVQIKIQTGRKHQIRKHMASLKHPVVGDTLYGTSSAQNKMDIMSSTRPKLQLTAWRLIFTCPFSKQLLTYQV